MNAIATALVTLTVTVWPNGPADASKTWTLRCSPTGGTLPGRVVACRRLTAMAAPFRPVPRDAACTQIYGGPQEAFVRGTFRGRRVWARFNRRDGCQIERWNRIAFFFAGAAGADR